MARSTLRVVGVEVLAGILIAVALLAALPASTLRGPEGGSGAPGGRVTPAPTEAPTPSPTPGTSVAPTATPGEAATVPSGDSRSGPVRANVRAAIPVISRGSGTARVVALTFDDGYSPTATARILSILQSEHVAATFFPYGAAVRSHPDVWRAVAAAGYPIGNHTQSHPDLTRLSATAIRSQLDRARATIERAIGVPMIPLARPPYGAWNPRTATVARDDGFLALVLWDVDTRDWTGVSASVIAARAEAGRNGSIVLMHAGPAQTPLALPEIIHWYRSRGYSFVTVPELLAASVPGLQPTPVPSTPGRGHDSAPPVRVDDSAMPPPRGAQRPF